MNVYQPLSVLPLPTPVPYAFPFPDWKSVKGRCAACREPATQSAGRRPIRPSSLPPPLLLSPLTLYSSSLSVAGRKLRPPPLLLRALLHALSSLSPPPLLHAHLHTLSPPLLSPPSASLSVADRKSVKGSRQALQSARAPSATCRPRCVSLSRGGGGASEIQGEIERGGAG